MNSMVDFYYFYYSIKQPILLFPAMGRLNWSIRQKAESQSIIPFLNSRTVAVLQWGCTTLTRVYVTLLTVPSAMH